jgi:hypothetical protein
MGSVPTAGFDPIFYLHHANVDRLWAAWQASHPTVALPAPEVSFQLQPFPRPHSAAWQTGADVESTEALGYRYRRFCFILPPFRIWEVATIDWPFPLRRLVDSVRVVIRSHHMQPEPVEIRAFVNSRTRTRRCPWRTIPASPAPSRSSGTDIRTRTAGSRRRRTAATAIMSAWLVRHRSRACASGSIWKSTSHVH